MKFPFNAVYPSHKDGLAMTPIRRRKLIFSYAPDWIITILLAAAFFSLDSVNGYRRMFSLEESSIRHPYAVHERVPNLALYMICFVSPFCIMPVINLITVRSWWDLHNSWLGLILSLSMTGALTQVVKITVGRPRPDLLDRCQPPAGLSDPPYGLTSWTVCTQTDEGILRDGFRSFFSGHSSLSFAGLGFLAFYLAGKMHLFDRRGHAVKSWLALSPFMAASLVAISRTMDYRHHWQDVLVGSVVGTLFAFFTYHQYYPALSSEYAHRPYSPRIKRDEDETLPTHRHSHTASLDENYELDGTVPRPTGPGPLTEVWKDHESAGLMDGRGLGQEGSGLREGGSARYSPPRGPGPALPPASPKNAETLLP
ncbi:hypothetical protein GALMADRAFT_133677 [Galerina marginata CBS 339.88]|uniref:Phosphatidic acid phosphatase type 2/haloperoxidase domain-containing protein n=1 Tax=Galerina marginata (strain CBS 339.88) TaxID=685588 RepID=A0A067TM97_GALM3|nr:hypothetical protein GALMADRAFT_133677 [Galerina marginata CBS 339.88]